MQIAFSSLLECLGPESRANRLAFLEEEPRIDQGQSTPERDAEIVESGRGVGDSISCHPVPKSSFGIFVDGVENSATAAWYLALPLRLAQVAAAAVLRDEEGEMREVVAEERQVTLLYPNSVDAEIEQRLHAFCNDAGIRPLPVALRQGEQDWGIALQKHVQAVRGDLESKVLHEASPRASEECWILADGRCPEPKTAPTKYVVGLVKSHLLPYFKDELYRSWVLNLPEGHRTPVFCATREEEGARKTYSWYLRLHESPDGPPWFGLIRLEMNDLDMALAHVDEITAWVLAERAPLSLPDSRYDRLLYPVRYIEQYLRSRLRSRWDLQALIG